jgi:hypothetical protein
MKFTFSIIIFGISAICCQAAIVQYDINTANAGSSSNVLQYSTQSNYTASRTVNDGVGGSAVFQLFDPSLGNLTSVKLISKHSIGSVIAATKSGTLGTDAYRFIFQSQHSLTSNFSTALLSLAATHSAIGNLQSNNIVLGPANAGLTAQDGLGFIYGGPTGVSGAGLGVWSNDPATNPYTYQSNDDLLYTETTILGPNGFTGLGNGVISYNRSLTESVRIDDITTGSQGPISGTDAFIAPVIKSSYSIIYTYNSIPEISSSFLLLFSAPLLLLKRIRWSNF